MQVRAHQPAKAATSELALAGGCVLMPLQLLPALFLIGAVAAFGAAVHSVHVTNHQPGSHKSPVFDLSRPEDVIARLEVDEGNAFSIFLERGVFVDCDRLAFAIHPSDG